MISSSDKKQQLLRQSVLYKDEMQEEFQNVKYRTDELLKKVLIIGGSLAITYMLFRQFSNSKRKRKTVKNEGGPINQYPEETEAVIEKQPSQFAMLASEIGSSLANQATQLLLQVAKEKLVELLKPKETNLEDDENS